MARALPIPRTQTYIAAPAPTRLIRRPPSSPLMPSRTANPTRATAIAKNPIAITNTNPLVGDMRGARRSQRPIDRHAMAESRTEGALGPTIRDQPPSRRPITPTVRKATPQRRFLLSVVFKSHALHVTRVQEPVGLGEKFKQTTPLAEPVGPVAQPVGPSNARSWESNSIRPTAPPTTAMTTNAAMIIRRTQCGTGGAPLLDHEFVKPDQRASSWKRATGSLPRHFLATI